MLVLIVADVMDTFWAHELESSRLTFVFALLVFAYPNGRAIQYDEELASI